jgi:hypothetical protein
LRLVLACVVGWCVLALAALVGSADRSLRVELEPFGAPFAGDSAYVALRIARHDWPAGGLRPALRISSLDERRQFEARPSGSRGRYVARVVFPHPGRWALVAVVGGRWLALGTVAVGSAGGA